MHTRGYKIRITESFITVEYRATPYSLLLPGIVFLCWFGFQLLMFFGSGDGSGLIIPVVFLVAVAFGLYRYHAAEMLRCDAEELHIAWKSRGRSWQRYRFPVTRVKDLRRSYRSTGKSGYTILTFQCDGCDWDIFRDIDRSDSSQILDACRSFGVEVPHDVAESMISDIAKRGWWVNPWKTDDISKQ